MAQLYNDETPKHEAATCFSLDYPAARTKFQAAIRYRKGTLAAYPHPSAFGRHGEVLSIDVGVIGPKDAPNSLLVISGTHGLEGRCGSAAQVGWLLGDGAAALPAQTNVVMIHAINPWGVSHGFRTTENNVDINRNFVDFTQPLPENPHYQTLHTMRTPRDWTRASLAATQAGLNGFSEQVGPAALFDTIARGQYTHADGINYGGHAREWSNLTLERIVGEHLPASRRVGLIDWHTGLGAYGEPFFLCFNEEGSALQSRAADWWSAQRVIGQKPLGVERPNYTGLVFHGVQSFLQDRPLCGAVVEFGTRDGDEMGKMLHLDRWLRYEGQPDSATYRMLHADLEDSFVPVEMLWRQKVLDEAVRITQQAVDGMGAWRD